MSSSWLSWDETCPPGHLEPMESTKLRPSRNSVLLTSPQLVFEGRGNGNSSCTHGSLNIGKTKSHLKKISFAFAHPSFRSCLACLHFSVWGPEVLQSSTSLPHRHTWGPHRPSLGAMVAFWGRWWDVLKATWVKILGKKRESFWNLKKKKIFPLIYCILLCIMCSSV